VVPERKNFILISILTIVLRLNYNKSVLLAEEEYSLAPLPFPNLGASTASAFYFLWYFPLLTAIKRKNPAVVVF
jgi:hypothetical protein